MPSNFITFYVVILTLFSLSASQTIINSETDENVTVVSTAPTPSTNASCDYHNNDCKGCIANSQCFYCESDKVCYYKVAKILTDDACALKKSYYWTCRTNLQTLVIIIGVFAGIAVLIVTVCCCYCCCKRKGIRISKDEIKWARQREERKQLAVEKRKERAERTEEIRKKYGLVKDANPYQRFDA